MPDEKVVDASVLGAAFFEESRTGEARAFLLGDHHLIAPDLLGIEIASICAKKVWRGLAKPDVGSEALKRLPGLVRLVRLSQAEISRAYELAQQYRFSAYDASYLSLAERRHAVLVTADDKLVRRAAEFKLGALVRSLSG